MISAKEKRLSSMTEKSDELLKQWFPTHLIRLGAVILCVGIAMGFAGNKLFGYLVDTNTNLGFQQVNARIEAVNARIDIDEKSLADDNAQLRELTTLANQINVIAQKVTDIKETVDKLQSYNSYNNTPSWAKERPQPRQGHDPSQPW